MLEHTEGSWYNKYISEHLKTKELQEENKTLSKHILELGKRMEG